MTLVLNEVHLLDGLDQTFLVAAADQRISNPDGSYNSTRPKLFEIPYLRGAISYFGLAAIPNGGKWVYHADWLPNFIGRQAESPDLHTFAENLRDELNRRIPPHVLRKRASGFHICGFDADGRADFWSLSNIGGMERLRYVGLEDKYRPPWSRFLGGDAEKLLTEWDSMDPSPGQYPIQIYRNGDIRAHVAAWEILDKTFDRLTRFPGFERPTGLEGYARYVKFKFEVIAYFYKCWADREIIARPIDVWVQPSWIDMPIDPLWT
jgi:hypothetical protein